MRRLLLAATAALALGAIPAHAEDPFETQPYTLSAVIVSGSIAGENIGGAQFGAPGFTPLRVVANDLTGTAVGLAVGQDLTGAVPGNIDPAEGDSYASGCGEVDLTTSAVAFDPSKPITVFVQTIDPACLEAVATTGTVDLFVQS